MRLIHSDGVAFRSNKVVSASLVVGSSEENYDCNKKSGISSEYSLISLLNREINKPMWMM